MRLRGALTAVAIMVATAALIFSFFQRQLLSRSFGIPADRELLTQLQDSLEDQKRLAQLEPELEGSYRDRFAKLERTVRRLQILEHSRERLARRYELVLLAIARRSETLRRDTPTSLLAIAVATRSAGSRR
jgi:hypothetical protein